MAVVRSITCRYWHWQVGRSTKTVIRSLPVGCGSCNVPPQTGDGLTKRIERRGRLPRRRRPTRQGAAGALPSSAPAAALERQLRPTLRCPAHAHARHPDRLVHVAPRSLPSPRASSPHHLATHHARAAAERRHAWTDGSARRRCGRPSSRPVTPAAPPSLTHVHPLPMQRGPRPPQGASSHDMAKRYAQAPIALACERAAVAPRSAPSHRRPHLHALDWGRGASQVAHLWHGHVVAWPLSLAPVVAWRRSWPGAGRRSDPSCPDLTAPLRSSHSLASPPAVPLTPGVLTHLPGARVLAGRPIWTRTVRVVHPD